MKKIVNGLTVFIFVSIVTYIALVIMFNYIDNKNFNQTTNAKLITDEEIIEEEYEEEESLSILETCDLSKDIEVEDPINEPEPEPEIEEVLVFNIYDTASDNYINELKEAEKLLFYLSDKRIRGEKILSINSFNENISATNFNKLLNHMYYLLFKDNYIDIETDPYKINDDNSLIINKIDVSNLFYDIYSNIRHIPSDKMILEENSITFTDINDENKRPMLFCDKLSIIEIDNEDTINFNDEITTEEAIVFVYRLYNNIIKYMETTDPLYNNETNCYRLLKRYSGFNNAVVAGIMANIASESGKTFDPDIHQYGDGPGYGICQWTYYTRKQGLYDYESVCGYPYNTLECQCQYLLYELETLTPKLLKFLNEVPNTSDGSYDAGYQFCLIFEAPLELEACSLSRGKNARKYFDAYENY